MTTKSPLPRFWESPVFPIVLCVEHILEDLDGFLIKLSGFFRFRYCLHEAVTPSILTRFENFYMFWKAMIPIRSFLVLLTLGLVQLISWFASRRTYFAGDLLSAGQLWGCFVGQLWAISRRRRDFFFTLGQLEFSRSVSALFRTWNIIFVVKASFSRSIFNTIYQTFSRSVLTQFYQIFSYVNFGNSTKPFLDQFW